MVRDNMYDMNLVELLELRAKGINQKAKLVAVGQTMLAEIVENRLRHIDTRIVYMEDKNIWDLV